MADEVFIQQITDVIVGNQRIRVISECLHNWEYGDGLRECYGCGTVERPANPRSTCGAGMDGDCYADGCPQRDPALRQEFCPLPTGNSWVALHEEGS